MLMIAYAVAAVTAVLVVSQCLVVAAFARQFLYYQRPKEHASCPKAAVILSLRGPDPYLSRTLKALAHLDYPDYSIHLVVDSEGDPVWEDVRSAMAACTSPNVAISVLKDPAPTCSLKCSSLVQAVRALDEEIEVVAFVDGDTVPHTSWLGDMVGPLSDPEVGVVTGNRWFVPTSAHWGTLVRYFWNVGAVVQVWLNGIVWAGSMAMRREVIERTGLLDAWGRALSVDATVCRQMRKHQLRVEFLPGVVIANHEQIGIRKFVTWVSRQLIAAKSCGPNWRLVALHALTVNGTQIAATALVAHAVFAGQGSVLWISVAGMVCYWASAVGSTCCAELAVRRILRMNHDPARWPPFAYLAFLPGLVLTHGAYCFALIRSYFQRTVTWRGIEYRIRGVNDIQMRGYRPYQRSEKRSRDDLFKDSDATSDGWTSGKSAANETPSQPTNHNLESVV